MSKAYICDKCGRIAPEPMSEVWLVDPGLFQFAENRELSFHLCKECFEQFRAEYMENLIENGGVA